MNFRTITNKTTQNGRSAPQIAKPIIKPLSNMINIERLLLTGLQSLDQKTLRKSFDPQVRKVYS